MEHLIRLVQFGSPMIQNQYKEICKSSGINFEDFQLGLIEDTGQSYDDLKSYWISGEELEMPSSAAENLETTYVSDYLIIHFDMDRKEVLGITVDDYECLTDGHDLFEEAYQNPNKFIRA